MVKQKEKLIRRLKIIEGQVRGLQEMVNNDKYCIDIITQSSSVKQSLSNIEDMLLEDHISGCLVHQIKSGKTEDAIKELMKVYRLKRK